MPGRFGVQEVPSSNLGGPTNLKPYQKQLLTKNALTANASALSFAEFHLESKTDRFARFLPGTLDAGVPDSSPCIFMRL
jgi:hypothetical protein